MNRSEKDNLGEANIPENALYGIHSFRAMNNFPVSIPFHLEWYKAVGLTKLAVYNTYRRFKEAVNEKAKEKTSLKLMSDKTLGALTEAATEVSEGLYFSHFVVPAIQGGAGTSINMNINEIIANAALISIDLKPGKYDFIHPVEHANIYQSTNDVIPTALRVATMKLFLNLEEAINDLRQLVEKIEGKSRNRVRLAYTQMQEAVPTTFGGLFSTYNEALSRDWWRVSKCLERIKVVNLGGGPTGTGISIPRFIIMEVVPELRNITSLPVTRSENLQDANANLDSLVEVHATIKAHAVNLEKMVSDLRLLASDIGEKIVSLPAVQTGSSIMPGKVNPVIPEFVISAAHKVYSNDNLISSLAGQGCLDLNAYLPIIGHALIESLKLLIAANRSLGENLFPALKIDYDTSYSRLMLSPSLTTILNPYIGYENAGKISEKMRSDKLDIYEAARQTGLIDIMKLKEILDPGNLTKLGFTLSDISD